MAPEQQTYTYTARNVNKPDKVVTFTLRNGSMQVNLTGLIDQAAKIKDADQKYAEAGKQVAAQAAPTVAKLTERISGPVSIRDVNANYAQGKLRVTLWQRLAGLRLAPVILNMGWVDNEEAAQAFVEEVDNRQKSSAHTGRFFGPLDYWLGWIGLLFVIVLLIRWPDKKTS